MNIVFGVLAGLYVVLAVWCIFDAFDRTDYGLVWLFLIAAMGPLFVPLYVIMRFYTDRPVSARTALQHELEREKWREFRLGSEIERAKFISQTMHGGGTMYDANAGLAVSGEGYRHFGDARAEQMLQQARFDEAWDYLIDLFAMAQSESDVRGLDTYRYYICRLPGGAALLREWESGVRPQVGPGPTASETGAMPQLLRPRRRRDVPF